MYWQPVRTSGKLKGQMVRLTYLTASLLLIGKIEQKRLLMIGNFKMVLYNILDEDDEGELVFMYIIREIDRALTEWKTQADGTFPPLIRTAIVPIPQIADVLTRRKDTRTAKDAGIAAREPGNLPVMDPAFETTA